MDAISTLKKINKIITHKLPNFQIFNTTTFAYKYSLHLMAEICDSIRQRLLYGNHDAQKSKLSTTMIKTEVYANFKVDLNAIVPKHKIKCISE